MVKKLAVFLNVTTALFLVPPKLPQSKPFGTGMGQETVRLCMKEWIQSHRPAITL